MAFAAGMHVFPGGRVDAADAAPELAARVRRRRRGGRPYRRRPGAVGGERHPPCGFRGAGRGAGGGQGKRWSPGRRRSGTLPRRWTSAFGPTCSRRCRGGSRLPAIRAASTRNSSLRCCPTTPPRPRSPATRSSRWSGSGRGTPSTRWRTAGSACGCRRARRSSNWSTSATSGIWRGSPLARSGRSSSTNPLPTSCGSSCRPGAALPASRSAPTSSVAAGSCWSTRVTPPDRPSNGVSRRPPDEPARSAPSR